MIAMPTRIWFQAARGNPPNWSPAAGAGRRGAAGSVSG
jgi:hypothetical protein